MKALDFNLEKILACFHSFFKLSTARRKELSDIMKISDEEIEFPLRLVSTHWLSAEPAISRILEHYDSLKQYFLETVPKSAAKQVLNLDVYVSISDFFDEGNACEKMPAVFEIFVYWQQCRY